MGIVENLLDRLSDRLGKDIQGQTPSQANRDRLRKGESYSVETEISEALADLVLMFSSVPVEGQSERAKWLDSLSSDFMRDSAKAAVSSAFVSGDCLVVPSWNGRNMQNIVVPSDDFVVTGCYGDEITSCAYVLDRKKRDNHVYQLMQAVELVPYQSGAGDAYACRYRSFAVKGGSMTEVPLSLFPEWEGKYGKDWYVPNVDRLLVARMKSHAIDPANVNGVKGVPICYGAGAAIAEIRYLLEQMHVEFGLSEKFVMADKRMFRREWRNGETVTALPRGKERVIMDVQPYGDGAGITEWAPDIRHQAYLDAIDKQEQLVERAVGVSGGIISRPNDMNYQNVDNVRKSQQKTIGFVNAARKKAESMMLDLVYCWDVLANFYGIVPMGESAVRFDWSDEYVETFADRQNAILAGEAIGATDAVDYRMYVMGESPEAARERVESIKATRAAESAVLMPV